jgi:protein transport protein SEC24
MDPYDQSAPAQKKKRAYAAQAYEFGGNAAGQQPGQVPPPIMAGGAPSYGIGQPLGQQPIGQPIGQPFGQPVGQPLGQPLGQPIGQPIGQAVGYQPAPPAPQDQLASQFGQMNIQSPQAQAPTQMAPPQNVNQLFPSDLISQPFVVGELDNPPPAINLPPNASLQLQELLPSTAQTDRD